MNGGEAVSVSPNLTAMPGSLPCDQEPREYHVASAAWTSLHKKKCNLHG